MSWVQQLRFIYRAWHYRWRVEAAEIRFVREQVRAGQTVLDIGAHKGAFTYWMQRAVGPTGRVFAFEPQPELAAYLEARVRALRLAHVTVVPVALSRACGTMTLTRPGAEPSPSATLEAGDVAPGNALAVRVETVDSFFRTAAEARPVRFIKCDVEGHELAVFQGAEQILREDRPVLLFECETRHHQGQAIQPVFEFLQGLAYDGFFFRRRVRQPLALFRPEYQTAAERRDYVYNFAFLPQHVATRGAGE